MSDDDFGFSWKATPDTIKRYPGHAVTCYRYWRIVPDNGTLRSVSSGHHWGPGRNTARCEIRDLGVLVDHPAPSPGCLCGFYGWYTTEEAVSNHGNSSIGLGTGLGRSLVLGAVGISGRFVPGTLGLRAEYAKPLGIVVQPGENPGWLGKALAEKYPDLEVFDSLAELVVRHPPQDFPWAREKVDSREIWSCTEAELSMPIRHTELLNAIRLNNVTPMRLVMSFHQYWTFSIAFNLPMSFADNLDVPLTFCGVQITFNPSASRIRLERA